MSNGEVTLKSEVAGSIENQSETCDDGKSKDESSHENMDIVRVADEPVEKFTNLIDMTKTGVVKATEEITVPEESLDVDSKVTKNNITSLDSFFDLFSKQKSDFSMPSNNIILLLYSSVWRPSPPHK